MSLGQLRESGLEDGLVEMVFAFLGIFALIAILALVAGRDPDPGAENEHQRTKPTPSPPDVSNRIPPKGAHAERLSKTSAMAVKELAAAIPELPSAKTAYICDGDTVDVVKQGHKIRIRLDSIDCPEGGQEWGSQAKFGLIKLIGGKRLRLEEYGVDYYGRTLATIYVWHDKRQDWLNVNEHMVTLGHAWVMRAYWEHLPVCRQTKLNRLESWSKSKQLGLWKESNPIPPWRWRADREQCYPQDGTYP